MNAPEISQLVQAIDPVVINFIGDASMDEGKRRDVQRKQDNIYSLVQDYAETLKDLMDKTKEDYLKRIQDEVDEINRIIQSTQS